MKMGMVIELYGPAGLLKKVRETKWEPTLPSGMGFLGILLGGYSLAILKDNLCSEGVEITIKEEGNDGYFKVTGYVFPSALLVAKCAAEREGELSVFGGPIKLAHIPLSLVGGDKKVKYIITVNS